VVELWHTAEWDLSKSIARLELRSEIFDAIERADETGAAR
jgi:hypothetical protein